MGRLLQNRTPAQLGWIIAASNLLIACSFAMLFVKWLPLWAGLASFTGIICGFVLELFAEAALRDGIASEEWPDALIATTRRFFTHPALAAAIILLIVASFAVILFWTGRHLAGAAWIFLAPSMSLTRVKAIFSRPRRAASLGRKDPPKPLQSDHWGIPPQPSSH
jgi:hypothetical protein